MSAPKHPWRLVAAAVLLAWVAFVVAMNVARRSGPPANAGDFGYTPDPAGVAKFLDELPEPFFAQAGADAMRQAVHRDTFLYRQMDRAHRARYGQPFKVGRQGIGDCVSWGAMHAVYCAESVDWDTGKIPEAPLLPSTESIYGGARVEARGRPGDGKSAVGGWSDGATGWGAARWLRDWGVVYRDQVGGHDLRVYDPQRAKAWGAYGNGGQGDGGRLDAIAKRHPCKHVVAVKTWPELVAAVSSGYPVTIASSVGFNSGNRDEHGFCRASGTWMHQMAVIGLRFAEHGSPRDGALIINSWGNYVGGGKWPADQPDGTFWASRPDIERILSQGDSYAIGSVDGFKFRDLDNGGWLDIGPIRSLSKASP
jgi:hypothetical protein